MATRILKLINLGTDKDPLLNIEVLPGKYVNQPMAVVALQKSIDEPGEYFFINTITIKPVKNGKGKSAEADNNEGETTEEKES